MAITVSEFELLELRMINQGSTMSTTYVAPNNSAWNVGNATKLRVFDLDIGGLVFNTVADKSIQQNFYGKPYPLKTTKEGTFSFKMWLEGGPGSNSPNTVASLLGGVMGGVKNAPQADATDEAEAACTINTINATAHGLAVGQACLFGTTGDSGGDGRAGVVRTSSTNSFTLEADLPAAPATDSKIYEGSTCYFDPDNQTYFDFLMIGSYPGTSLTDESDQYQMLGCSGTFKLGGLGVEEKPFVEFTFNCAQWKHVRYSAATTFSYASDASGGDPVGDLQSGSMVLINAAAVTRAGIAGGDITIEPNMQLSRVTNLNYDNRTGGWQKVPAENGPTVAITRYWGDSPSILQAFEGVAGNDTPTAKQLLLQFGNTLSGTVVIYFPKLWLKSMPSRVEMEKNTAMKLEFQADTPRATSYLTANDKLADSPMTITFI